MILNNKYSDLGFLFRDSATEDLIQRLVHVVGKSLPSAYLDFLRYSNGADGTFINIFEIDLAIKYFEDENMNYFMPGFLVFGSNGGGEAYGYNLNAYPYEIVMMPFIGGEWDIAVHCGTDFFEFLKKASSGFSFLEGKMFEFDD
ncbi:MAG TPA: hypothetical protein DCG54_03270 [Anaerolineae bacterium]|nr:hypothetical protein [Anaerolineae bacterium]